MDSTSPGAWDRLTVAEQRDFDRLKGRLAQLWPELFPRDEEAYTSVVVPSVSVSPAELACHPEAHFFEELLLFFMIRLRNPRARLVYVTSQPITPAILDYYMLFLAGIPTSHARARFTNVAVHDQSPRPLAEKVLERPRLIRKIRAAIPDPTRAYLTTFRSTPLECRLALALGIPLNGPEPGIDSTLTKSEGRRLFREAGIQVPAGVEDLRSKDDLVWALADLRRRRPGLQRALMKLDTNFWDEGHALYTYSIRDSPRTIRESLAGVEVPAAPGCPDRFLERFERAGGVVEEFVEDAACTTTSAQIRINPTRVVFLTSTHDEMRGGALRTSTAGCRFPASDAHRALVQEAGMRVGRVLADRGVVGRISVEMLVAADDPGRPLGSEIRLGVGGSTHPLLAVRFLTGGRLDPDTGLFHSPAGRAKYYRATDALASPSYRALSPEDLIEILAMGRLNYSPHTESGALFYMLGAIAELGRVGLIAIGNSREEAEAVYDRVVETLDSESRS